MSSERGRRGPKEDPKDGEYLDAIGFLSFVGRIARAFYEAFTTHVEDEEVKQWGQRNARRLEEDADRWRDVVKRKRAQYREDNPWR